MYNCKNNITTVNGIISIDELQYCQCHEHLFIKRVRPDEIDSSLTIDNYKMTVNELKMYKNSGGDSIVDAQPLGCGRMTNNLIRAGEETKINIIASTGFHKLEYYPRNHWIYKITETEFTELLLKELITGMYTEVKGSLSDKQTSARAGIIKTAVTGENISGIYKRLLLASARAANETGVTIMCHTEKGQGALNVIKLLIKNGIAPDSIIMCHLDRRIDNVSYQKEVARTGVFLDYDTIGRFKYHSDEEEIKLILNMLAEGYEDKLLISLDTTRERLKSYGGNIGLSYILTYFIPELKKYGVQDNIINKITRRNPVQAIIRR